MAEMFEFDINGYLVQTEEEYGVSPYFEYDSNDYIVPLETVSTGPNAANLLVVDNGDGATATATLSGCTAGATYNIYTTRNQVIDWSLSGTRVGNGDVTLTLSKGEYISTVIGGTDVMSVGQVAIFWVTTGASFRTRTRTRTAQSLLRTISGGGTSRAKGVQVVISNPGDDDVTVWAMDINEAQVTGWKQGFNTDDRTLTLLIPVQTGFPLADWDPGITVTYEGVEYGVDNIDGAIDLSPSFTFTCSRKGDSPYIGDSL